MSKIFSVIGRLFKDVVQPASEATPVVASAPEPVATAAVSGIHPGLTDQQLVVLLTAAACEVIGGPVRIEKFRPLTARDLNWAAQGRSELHTHRLK